VAECERRDETHGPHMVYPAGQGPPSRCPGAGRMYMTPAEFAAWLEESHPHPEVRCARMDAHEGHEHTRFDTLEQLHCPGRSLLPPADQIQAQFTREANELGPYQVSRQCEQADPHEPHSWTAGNPDGWIGPARCPGKLAGAEPPQFLEPPGMTNLPGWSDGKYGHELMLVFRQDAQLEQFQRWLDGPGWAAFCGWAETQDHDKEDHGPRS
jgi:hypothetical protein